MAMHPEDTEQVLAKAKKDNFGQRVSLAAEKNRRHEPVDVRKLFQKSSMTANDQILNELLDKKRIKLAFEHEMAKLLESTNGKVTSTFLEEYNEANAVFKPEEIRRDLEQLIKTNFDSQLPDEFVHGAVDRLSPHLKGMYTDYLDDLISEMNSEFLKCERTAAVNAILRDHSRVDPYVLASSSQVPTTWKQDFMRNKNAVLKKFYLSHPIHRQILYMTQDFQKHGIIDFHSTMQNSGSAIKLSTFRSMLLVQSEKSRDYFLHG
jgi:hypothetical protein